MKNFRDVPVLHEFLQKAYELGGQQQGQALLAHVLEAKFDFTQDQAKLYASTVLSRSAETSAASMTANAGKVIGTWVQGTQSGIPGGWLKTMRETWEFDWGLEFEHKRQTDESYVNPFGGGFSRPTSWSERGQWAPSDSEPGKELCLVLMAKGIGRHLQLLWSDVSEKPSSFSIGGTTYFRER